MTEVTVILNLGEYVLLTNGLTHREDLLQVFTCFWDEVHLATSNELIQFNDQIRSNNIHLWNGPEVIRVTFEGPAFFEGQSFLGFHFTLHLPVHLEEIITIIQYPAEIQGRP